MAGTTASSATVPVRTDRWLALGVISTAQLMTALDATVVNIALPSAQRALGFGDADRQWVVTAYTVCFAGLLLLGGRIADVVGRRRAFAAGVAGFAAASLLAGLAPNLPTLVAGRALQGACAAVISPAALSLLAVTFTEPKQRARAFAVFGAVASSGAAAGLLLGGVLTEYLDWRWCLFVNVAIAGGVLILGRRVLPDPPRFPGAGLDLTSAVLATGGLAGVVLGCGRAAGSGWSSVEVVLPLAGGAAALAAFVARQRLLAAPLLPLRLLASRNRVGAYLAAGTAVVGAFGMFLILTYYLQVILHYSPIRAGLAVLPLTLANVISGYQLGNRLLPHVRPRLLMAGGLLAAAGGLALLGTLHEHSTYAASVLPAELLVGVGMGALFPATFTIAIAGVSQRDTGVASALITTATQVGSSLGTAVLNTVAVSATAGYLAAHRPTPPTPALVHGYATATGWSAVLLAGMAVLVAVLVTAPRPTNEDHPRPSTT
ncbi:MAG TPA: MFS transporter [Mycobacteriales bacterium]